MKKTVSLLLFSLVFATAFAAPRTLFIGSSSDKGLFTCSFDPYTGRLSGLEVQDVINMPTFIEIDRTTKTLYTYIQRENDTAFAMAYRFDPQQVKLTRIDKKMLPAKTGVHLSLVGGGRTIAHTSYWERLLITVPIMGDGTFAEHTGTRIFPGRDADLNPKARPHAALEDAGTGDIYVTDLGMDSLFIFRLEENRLELKGGVGYPAGSGPRHMAFSPDGKYLATICETSGYVDIFGRNASGIFTERLQSLPSVPADNTLEIMSADIKFTPDGKFLYTSTREADQLAMFSFDAKKGEARLLGVVTEGISMPRALLIDDSGSYMLVANQQGDNVTVYKIDRESGKLTWHDKIDVPVPAALKFW